jgi:di/tricarboxylate transporter
MAKASLGKLAYILALIGGIILVIQGLLSFVGMAFMTMFMPSVLGSLGSFWGIIEIILGVVAIYGAKRVTDLTWAIVLIVVGLIGGGLGGILVLLGGIVGLVSKYV